MCVKGHRGSWVARAGGWARKFIHPSLPTLGTLRENLSGFLLRQLAWDTGRKGH